MTMITAKIEDIKEVSGLVRLTIHDKNNDSVIELNSKSIEAILIACEDYLETIE